MQGPTLRAVIETNPSALSQAEALDRERTLTGLRGPLHGIPIIVKDNIATLHSEGIAYLSGSPLDSVLTSPFSSGMNTTAGKFLCCPDR